VKYYAELLAKMRDKTLKRLDPELEQKVLELEGFE
jgi:hypothetical protein